MIFDLDDTLIETSKCLIPHALISAFDAMQKAGLNADASAIDELFMLNKTALTARDALRAFTSLFPNGELFFKIGLNTLHLPLSKNVYLEPVPHALEVLDSLSKTHHLALVTKGEEALQMEKMEKAGIQPERFSKLIVSRAPTKKRAYKAVIDHFGYPPEEVAVCGDRVSLDLTPAKDLGLYTIHFRNGRGLYHAEPKESVDATIDCLIQLGEVLTKHEV